MGIAELITESAEIWYPSGAHEELAKLSDKSH